MAVRLVVALQCVTPIAGQRVPGVGSDAWDLIVAGHACLQLPMLGKGQRVAHLGRETHAAPVTT